MNRERVLMAIDVMQRAADAEKSRKIINMNCWQTLEKFPPDGIIVKRERDFHACGNTACFGGYLALSQEWKETGGKIGVQGQPRILNLNNEILEGVAAVSFWLQLRNPNIAENLMMPYHYSIVVKKEDGSKPHIENMLYGKKFKDVTAKDVLEKLELLLIIGEKAFATTSHFGSVSRYLLLKNPMLE